MRRVRKVVGELAAVDRDRAVARAQPYACHRTLAATGGHHQRGVLHSGGRLRQRDSYDLRACSMASGWGFCAAWGWFGPVYTFSFLSIWRPSRFFGSIPRTDLRTASVGLTSSRLA